MILTKEAVEKITRVTLTGANLHVIGNLAETALAYMRIAERLSLATNSVSLVTTEEGDSVGWKPEFMWALADYRALNETRPTDTEA